MSRRVLEDAWAPAVVPVHAVTEAVVDGTTTGFRPAWTNARATDLLLELRERLEATGVTDLGAASSSVVATNDAGVVVEVGIVVPAGSAPAGFRLRARPAHIAATLLVRGDQDDPAWNRLRSFVETSSLTPAGRPYTVFQHPRPTDRRQRVTQLVLPVARPT